MSPVLPARLGRMLPVLIVDVARSALFLLPAALLGIASLRAAPGPQVVLRTGAAVILVGALASLIPRLSRSQWLPSLGISLYVVGLAWLWMATRRSPDWYSYLGQAILLIGPVLTFGLLSLRESGAAALHRAQRLTSQLAGRKDLPRDLAASRALPEVRALRDAVREDATPALLLTGHQSVEVRVAALCALESRKKWRPGQAELVLQLAQGSKEPAVRAAAVMALGAVDDRLLIEALAPLLWDPSWEVRRAAANALLSNSERRWHWIRHAVRRALAEPSLHNDGPLECASLLSPEAVADLTAWAAEKGLISVRASLALGAHYTRALHESPDAGLVARLRTQLDSSQTPPTLRVELARVLQANRELDRLLLERLLLPTNPAPLRLLAAETLLAERDHPEAVHALHDLARLPNREIALATADLLQRHLGVDLGLAAGAPLPPLHSRQAAEITRRVMNWANERDHLEENVYDSR